MASNLTSANDLLYYVADILAGGINGEIAGHGGAECMKYLGRSIRILDTSIGKFEIT